MTCRCAGSNLVLDLLGKPVRRLVVTEDAPTFAVLVDFANGPPPKPRLQAAASWL